MPDGTDTDTICACRAGSGRICDTCWQKRRAVIAERLQQLPPLPTSPPPTRAAKPAAPQPQSILGQAADIPDPLGRNR